MKAISFLSAGVSIFAAGFSVGLNIHGILSIPPRNELKKEVKPNNVSLIIDNDLAGHMPLDDPFDGATCGGIPQKLTCNVDDFPPACIPMVEEIYECVNDVCEIVQEDLANEQTPCRAYKSSVGYLPYPFYIFHNNLTK